MSIATEQRNVGLGDRRGRGDRLRDRQAGQAGRRRRPRPLGRDDGAGDGAGADGGARGRGLLPAHRRRRGAHVRRREDPRRFLQARGQADRAGDPDRADDRPPDPAAVAEGVPERGAGDLHDALRRPRHTARHPLHQRRLGGADALAAALPGAGGRRADRDDRRRARPQPDPADDRGVEARPDRRRHEGRADDGRGRGRGGSRGHALAGVRARAPRDHQALRGPGGAAREGRQAEVARARGDGRPEGPLRRHAEAGDRDARPPRGGTGRRDDRERALPRPDDGVDRGRHPQARAGPLEPGEPARVGPDGGGRASGAGAVRARARGA